MVTSSLVVMMNYNMSFLLLQVWPFEKVQYVPNYLLTIAPM